MFELKRLDFIKLPQNGGVDDLVATLSYSDLIVPLTVLTV